MAAEIGGGDDGLGNEVDGGAGDVEKVGSTQKGQIRLGAEKFVSATGTRTQFVKRGEAREGTVVRARRPMKSDIGPVIRECSKLRGLSHGSPLVP